MRICNRCNKREATDGRLSCLTCRDNNRKAVDERQSRLIENNLCVTCGKSPLKSKRLCATCLEKANRKSKQNHREYRLDAFNAYGGAKCFCCGETTIEFLSIDHIEGSGNQHRKEFKHGKLHYWLKRNNYPTGFRVACMNCNTSMGFFGYCPHQEGTKFC